MLSDLSPPPTVGSRTTSHEKRRFEAASRKQIRRKSKELSAEEAELDEMESVLASKKRHCARAMREMLALKSNLGLQIAARDSAELGSIRNTYQSKLDRIAQLARMLDAMDPAFNGSHPAGNTDDQSGSTSATLIGDPHDILLEYERLKSEAEHLELSYPSLRKGFMQASETTITTASSMYFIPIENTVSKANSSDSGGVEDHQVDLSDESNHQRLRTSSWLFGVLRANSVERLQYNNISDRSDVKMPVQHGNTDWVDYIYASWSMDTTVTGD